MFVPFFSGKINAAMFLVENQTLQPLTLFYEWG